MTTLADYQLSECLYEGTRTEVYRGISNSDRASVIVKILRQSHPNFTQLVQFRNQYAIARHLQHPNILTPIALERYGNGYALIMPDDGAIALHDYWQQETPNTEEFLEIALQLADALHYLGQEQIIHKDIKPANILICPETKQVKLIDFSISTLLPKETQTIQTAVLEGTLAYLSPEQTGRMNRGIDYRSDFYALGVTFYELLTGTVPFASDDPLELIHAHIAQSPKPIVSVRIPEVLSDIVLKLMAKNAEDRYQSALGLRYDLDSCSAQYQETKTIVPFALGEQDRCDRFLIPEKLYGRESEVQTLLDAFERVANPDGGSPRTSGGQLVASPSSPSSPSSQSSQSSPSSLHPTPYTLHPSNVANPPKSPLTKGGLDVANPPSSQSSPSSLHPTPYTLHPSSVEMVLVAGFSGIGKTAVINEVHKPIVRQRGYFIKGKFDQFNRNIPFSAFVQAFRDLMAQLLGESDTQLQQWKGKILEAVGENGQVLIDVIPELERIIGQQPNVPELSGTAAQNRFNLLFEKFIAVFTTKEHPLTLFLDDLQWADSASLNLIKVLMGGENQTGYLLLLGAYRDNEVFPAHPLMLALGDLQKRCDRASVSGPRERAPRERCDRASETGARERAPRERCDRASAKDSLGSAPREQMTKISTITLAPLSVAHINQLVAETLSCKLELAAPLTDLVYENTKGNPFFTTQFLKGLHEDGLITFDRNMGYWECDLVKVREASLTDDVVEFMARRLHKLPEETQNVLKLAACIGNQFDLETLAIICEKPSEEVAANLWSALREGLVLPQSQAYKFFQGWEQKEEKAEGIAVGYRFLHDRVQQAAYSLIPDGTQKEIYLKIGQLFLSLIPESEREKRIFSIVDPLNLALDLIVDPIFKQELIGLNLLAGRQAKRVTAYEAAFRYLQQAIELLSEESWQNNYGQTLDIYNAAVETAYLSGHVSQMEAWIQQVLDRATSIYDRIPVTRTKLQALSSSKQLEVVGESLRILSELEIVWPENPTSEELQQARQKTEEMLARQPLGTIVELPVMSDRHFLAVATILQASIPTIVRINPGLFQLMVLQLIQLSLDYGNTSLSSFGYVCYAFMCCSDPKSIDRGYEIAQVALATAEKMGDKTFQTKTLFVSVAFIYIWKRRLKDVTTLLLQVYQLALEAGDLEFVGYSAWHYCHKAFLSNENLQLLITQVVSYVNRLQKLGQHSCLNWIKSYEFIIELLNNRQPLDIALEQFYARASLHEERIQEENDVFGLFVNYLNRGIANYWFGNNKKASFYLKSAEENINIVAGEFIGAIFSFYSSLVNLQLYLQQSQEERSATLGKVDENCQILQRLADNAPTNFQHKVDLLEAEKARILGDRFRAIESYDRAIDGAKANEYIQEEALANELAAKFYLDWGKEKYAALHMTDAYYCYARWGAKAKVEDLETRYPQLLAPILQQQQESFATNSLATMTRATLAKTTTGTGDILDLATLMKASRTLSENIELEGAIANVMQIARKNAGAQTIALMLFEEDVLMLVAKGTGKELSVINPLPVKTSNAVPLRIVNQVKRSQQPLLLENATEEAAWAKDAYWDSNEKNSQIRL